MPSALAAFLPATRPACASLIDSLPGTVNFISMTYVAMVAPSRSAPKSRLYAPATSS